MEGKNLEFAPVVLANLLVKAKMKFKKALEFTTGGTAVTLTLTSVVIDSLI